MRFFRGLPQGGSVSRRLDPRVGKLYPYGKGQAASKSHNSFASFTQGLSWYVSLGQFLNPWPKCVDLYLKRQDSLIVSHADLAWL